MANALDWITGIAGGITGIAAPIVDAINTKNTNKANTQAVESTNQANRDIAESTNQTNRDIAAENLKYQRELQEYQKGLQEEIFNREDTAYERTAQDMLKAGLNPLTMQGTNGAGETIAMTPLQNQHQEQMGAPMQAAQIQKSNVASAMLQAAQSLVSNINELQTGTLTRDKLRQENRNNEVNFILDNIEKGLFFDENGKPKFDEETFDKWLDYKKKFLESETWNSTDNIRQKKHMENNDIYDTDSKIERAITALTDWLVNGRAEEAWHAVVKKYPFLKFFEPYAQTVWEEKTEEEKQDWSDSVNNATENANKDIPVLNRSNNSKSQYR